MKGFVLNGRAMLGKFFLLLTISLFCEGIMAQKADNQKDVLEKLQEPYSVGKMEIIQFSPDALTRAAITPDRLEKIYHYKLTVRERNSPYFLGLKQALKDTKIEKTGRGGDVRWGVILFDLEGQRIVSIYVDSFGVRGYIDATPVTFSTKLEEGKDLSWWLKSNFLDVFKY